MTSAKTVALVTFVAIATVVPASAQQYAARYAADVVHLEDARVEVSEEERPKVLELQCDECENALNFDEIDEGVRRELLLTLGAR